MCGIAGFITSGLPEFDVEATIRNMTNSMAHRGPDGMGFELLSFDGDTNRSCIAFGHRRLKIIDLSENARQPMSASSGTYFITYNGEVYNYIELREELERKGHSFLSSSDTEVILKAYEEWGPDCFRRFNGMWALAILDKKRRRIVLSRDRFGKKPLYYCKTKASIVFGSEIKALFYFHDAPREPNCEKIFRYIACNYRYVDIDTSSFFAGIYQTPKGSYLEIDEFLNIKEKKYWSLGTELLLTDVKDNEAIDQFREIFIDSVRVRLRSDVLVGCMLSGGMDSTSVTCVSYKILKQPIITFSGITGEEKGIYDESEYIDSVIKETNANSHYIKHDPKDIFDTIDEMLDYHDEPICTVSWYSLFLIAKQIGKKNVPVVLNGHAGDELLGGYWEHYHYNFHELIKSGNLKAYEHELECWKKNHNRDTSETKRYKEYIEELFSRKTTEMQRFSDYSFCFKEDVVAQHQKDVSIGNIACSSLLTRRLYSELFFETVPASLRPEDRNTMSQSIESRSPFLDYRLVEFCFSLPSRFKIRDGVGKWILREAMRGILPEDVRTRKYKAGLIAPADEWFRTINRNQVYDLINSQSFKSRALFDVERINGMFNEHLRREKNHQMVLWQLINLELWFRKFFDA